MEFRQLRYFKVIADARSFARGAQDLRVAQPALSRSIAKLEEELGQSLFVRHNAGVSLTDAGERLYEYALRVLGSVRELVEGMGAGEEDLRGTILLGAPQSIHAMLVMPVACRFLSRYAHCRLDLVQDSSARLRDRVIEGGLDLAIVSNVVATGGLHLVPLLRESICLICPSERRPAFGEQVRIGELMNLPLIVGGYPQSLSLFIDRRFPHLAADLNIRSEVNSSAMVAEMVQRGVGFGIAPQCVQGMPGLGGLAFVPIEGLEVDWSVAVNWERRGARAVEEIEAMLRTELRSLVASGTWPTAQIHEVSRK